MLILTQDTDSIQIVLDKDVTTDQLECVSCWRDITTSAFTPGRTLVLSDNTNDADLVPSPAASTQRVVDYIGIHNKDTAAITVTVKFDANGTEMLLWKGIVMPGDTLTYVEGSGWLITGDGYRVTKEYMLHGDAGANFVMTNATLAERFAGNTTRHIRVVNAAGYSQVRFLANVQVASASASTPKLRLRYYTSWNATFANYLQLGASGHVEVSVFTGTAGTLQDSGWIDLASGAMADGIALAMCEVGGDAAADPAIGWAAVWFR